jgi:hypothetical protein
MIVIVREKFISPISIALMLAWSKRRVTRTVVPFVVSSRSQTNVQ